VSGIAGCPNSTFLYFKATRRANFRLGHAGRQARTVSGCLNSAFLGLFLTSCDLSFSGNGYPTQRAVNTCRPRSDRFWLLELRVSQHFSTFYGSSVQAMDTQLNALQTIAKPSCCTVHVPLKVQGSLVYVRRGNPRHIT
jgi:hypothetical protein